MRNEEDKAELEIEVFKKFSAAAALRITSVEKRLPPEPDLLCEIKDEGIVAFELVELCDKNLARPLANPFAPESQYIRTSDPSADILIKKFKKNYRTTYPIELLCYTDGRIITPANVILPTIQPYFASFDHCFRRGWLWCDNEAHLI